MRAGKIYDFNPMELDLHVGDSVVVETDRGQSLARVAYLKYIEKSDLKNRELKPVIRVATEKDTRTPDHLKPEDILEYAANRIKELKLEMRVLKADPTLGGNKVTLYFTAPKRVDFRELVKNLAGKFRTRVELKQVGPRDEAKLLGGVGVCGREFCCSTFLREFLPVSIKMAKNQNLALNPAKLSGGCGRLLCCLTYEDDTYKEIRKTMPKVGKMVQFDPAESDWEEWDEADAPERNFTSKGKVIKVDLLNEMVLLVAEDGEKYERSLQEIEFSSGRPGSDAKSRGSKPDRNKQRDKSASDKKARAEAKARADQSEEASEWAEDIDLGALLDS